MEDLSREADSLRRGQFGEVSCALVLNPTGTHANEAENCALSCLTQTVLTYGISVI